MTALWQMRKRHLRELTGLLEATLDATDWRLNRTARELGLSISSLQALIRRCGLAAQYEARKHPPGAPHGPRRAAGQ